ncbi:MAG: hypothetical protein AAF805_05890 [Planctomycetota bacterium]
MPDAVSAPDPVRQAIDDWAAGEDARSASLAELIAELAGSLGELSEWAAARESAEAEDAAAHAERDELLRRLEHDLRLSRGRVADLESQLQQRTRELLEAQAANNELAAQLQEAPLQEAALDPPGEDATDADDAAAGSVAQRFARLRDRRQAG